MLLLLLMLFVVTVYYTAHVIDNVLPLAIPRLKPKLVESAELSRTPCTRLDVPVHL